MHSERPKLCGVLAVLSAIGLRVENFVKIIGIIICVFSVKWASKGWGVGGVGWGGGGGRVGGRETRKRVRL